MVYSKTLYSLHCSQYTYTVQSTEYSEHMPAASWQCNSHTTRLQHLADILETPMYLTQLYGVVGDIQTMNTAGWYYQREER